MKLETIKKRNDFVLAYNQGTYVATKGIILQANRNNEIEYQNSIRIGYTVTKKIGKSVVRNRIKRRLRAVTSSILPKHAKENYDYVLIGRKNTLDRPYKDLQKDLKYALHKLELFKK